jgi:hypothetical protein
MCGKDSDGWFAQRVEAQKSTQAGESVGGATRRAWAEGGSGWHGEHAQRDTRVGGREPAKGEGEKQQSKAAVEVREAGQHLCWLRVGGCNTSGCAVARRCGGEVCRESGVGVTASGVWRRGGVWRRLKSAEGVAGGVDARLRSAVRATGRKNKRQITNYFANTQTSPRTCHPRAIAPAPATKPRIIAAGGCGKGCA